MKKLEIEFRDVKEGSVIHPCDCVCLSCRNKKDKK